MTANPNPSTLQAIRLLREKKLAQGIPFMINSDILDSKQCYMEYPDGTIKIVEADPHNCDFRVVFEYSLADSAKLRKQLMLL